MPEWNLTGPKQQEEQTPWKLEGPQDQGPNYLQRTIANIPSSAAALGHQMIHPEEEIADIYALGKKIKSKYQEGGVSGVAESAAKHLYNSIIGLPSTFEKDPVGTAVGAGQLLVAGPEALAARGVKGLDEAAIAAKTASLPERIAKLPERTEVPMSEAERTADIKAKAGVGIQAAKDAGDTIPASEAKGLLDKIKSDTASEYNPETHDAARGFFKKFEAKLPKEEEGQDIGIYGDTGQMMARMAPVQRASLEKKLSELSPKEENVITVKDLHNLRQELNDVHKHAYRQGYDQEGMVASKAKAAIDDFIVNKMDQGQWSTDMRNYALSSTAEEIRNLTDRALYRKTNLSAGQKAAALNTELRQWARPTLKGPNANMKMLRKLAPEAANQMERAATGGSPMDAILRGLGSASPGSIMSFSLDNIAGHLLHGIIPGGPYTIMGIGAAAKYLGGRSVENSIEKIIQTLNNAAEAEPNLTSLQKAVSPGVFDQLMSRPRTAQAIRNWANATGDRKRIATIALTAAIAKEVNRPDLQGRIKQEIDNIDPNRTTTVPEQMAQL